MGSGNYLQPDLTGLNAIVGLNVSPYSSVSNLFKGTRSEFPGTVAQMKKYFQPNDQEPCDNYGCN